MRRNVLLENNLDREPISLKVGCLDKNSHDSTSGRAAGLNWQKSESEIALLLSTQNVS